MLTRLVFSVVLLLSALQGGAVLRVEGNSINTESVVLPFLDEHIDTSLFLLGNYLEHGPLLTDEANSGNLRVIMEDNSNVRAVFMITKAGFVLAQTDKKMDYSPLIAEDILNSNIKVKGVVGDWEIAKPVWDRLTDQLALEPRKISREPLFFLSIRDLHVGLEVKGLSVRFLNTSEYTIWSLLNKEYSEELQLPLLSDEVLKRSFEKSVEKNIWWGAFYFDQLVGMTSLNGKVMGVGQIGGVFVRKDLRKKGIAKALLSQLLLDSKKVHALERLVLFTSEDNVSSLALYRGLGFVEKGCMGLLIAN